VTSGSWGPGDAAALKHGARSRLPAPVDEADLAEVRDAIAAAAPVRDATGDLPAADQAAVEMVARALKRYRQVNQWCEMHGRFEERTGKQKPAATYELQAEAALARALDAVGMTPMARSKLGLNLATAFDLARAWQEEDAGA
jgi:P27 family predicted phage terminase small subunit